MTQHRTPLRYPGGKQKLTPFVIELLKSNNLIGGHYVEPYAGGAGVAMELLIAGYVKRVHLNDSSLPIYAFWKSITSQPEEFCRRISSASLSIGEWRKQREILRNPTNHDLIDLGFSTFYLNRCNRSGVLTGGVIGGLSQTGPWKIDARFPKKELIKRVETIGEKADAIVLRNWDAEKFLRNHVSKLSRQTLIYCDPPYFEKSSRLYLDHYIESDHQRISETIQTDLIHKWIVSYDGAPEILKYYKPRRKFVYDLQYNASRAYKGREVFIFSDDLLIPEASSLPFINIGLSENKKLFRLRKESFLARGSSNHA